MLEFLQNYGFWIALLGVILLMHRLGMGCCGGHAHGWGHGSGTTRTKEREPAQPEDQTGQTPTELTAASTPRRGGCHCWPASKLGTPRRFWPPRLAQGLDGAALAGGGHTRQRLAKEVHGMSKDPVCGMKEKEEPVCTRLFERDPGKYADK
jgi:hypothetical protein